MDPSRSYLPANTNLEEKRLASRETMDVLHEMATLLGTGLSREALVQCVKLCEMGINPEAVAGVVKELRREADATTGNTGP
ncbi:hypothetical protein IWQ60_012437 [Tieghemiomyces parasiticus]|uniref:Mitotic-spindle organizing protein 1 n=1 Tax=Tieghemiomyces parasiticus TaxID=78921 RepID=A0A9W8DGF5_9FUNG|nr:hypothetical protein IWQ60_012437 [Tieghemiomyces parasiticus]